MGKNQAVAGSSTLLERSDFDLGIDQGGQGCGDGEGGQASAAESSCNRLHCECAKVVTARKPLDMIKVSFFFLGFILPLYNCYYIRHPASEIPIFSE